MLFVVHVFGEEGKCENWPLVDAGLSFLRIVGSDAYLCDETNRCALVTGAEGGGIIVGDKLLQGVTFSVGRDSVYLVALSKVIVLHVNHPHRVRVANSECAREELLLCAGFRAGLMERKYFVDKRRNLHTTHAQKALKYRFFASNLPLSKVPTAYCAELHSPGVS